MFGITFRQPFRMKLHAQHKRHPPRRFRPQFHRFNDPVTAPRRRHQRLRRFQHRLMVRTVHAQNPLPGNSGQQRTGCQRHFMHQFARLIHAPMVERAGNLPADVRDQPPAQRDIQHLMPAANRQQRFALAEYFVNQHQLAQVASAAVRCLRRRFCGRRAEDFCRKDRD